MSQDPYIIETLAPADAAAVAEAVRNANSQGKAVYPIGGGTRFDYGVAPPRPGVGIALGQLNRVIDYPADDMTITVEAGITIAELNRCLSAHRQWLPVDVAFPDQATVGGAMAVNAAGPRRYAYGTMRDYVLGFTAVDAAGNTFSGGGRVVKNAAGYNMCRLMTGSLGTLGIVTQVTLLVRPLPEASLVLIGNVPQLDKAERVLSDLVHSATRPVAIELISGRYPLDPTVSGPMVEGISAILCIGFEGPSAEVEWMADQLRKEWSIHGLTTPSLMSGPQSDEYWRRITELSVNMEIHVLPSAVVTTINEVHEVVKVVPQVVLAHAGNGVILFSLPLQLEGGRCESEPEGRGQAIGGENRLNIVDRLRSIATTAGGTLVVLRSLEGVTKSADIWGPPSSAASIMQAVKDRLDPKNILNPGRFVFP